MPVMRGFDAIDPQLPIQTSGPRCLDERFVISAQIPIPLGGSPHPLAEDRLRPRILALRLFMTTQPFRAGTALSLSTGPSDANLEALKSPLSNHRLEKGLSHVQRRASFGADAAQRWWMPWAKPTRAAWAHLSRPMPGRCWRRTNGS